LGEGGFGKVYRGIVHGTIVAIKELKDETISQVASRISGFEGEIRIFSTLNHENILKFMGACLPTSTSATPYYAFLTELAENGSLYDCLYGQARVPVKFSFSKKMSIIAEIVSGMTYLHNLEKPVFHLDLKTANILLDSNYSVRIADFGLSKLFGNHLISSGVSTFIGGTPYYMSPEILDGKFDMNTGDKADVYAFGILLNEFMDEKIPYTGVLNEKSKFTDLKNKVTKGEEYGVNRPILAKGPSVIKELIKRCWKLVLEERPSFKEIRAEKPWDKAKLTSSATSDKNTQQLLELFKGDIKAIQFGYFVEKCREVLNESLRLFIPDPIAGPFDEPFVRTLVAALDIPSGKEKVNEENVRRILTWVNKSKKNEMLDLLYSFMNKEYFFGVMDDDQVKLQFTRDKVKPGSYLVRWSNVHGAFVLDYIPKKKKNQAADHIESLNLTVSSIQELETALTKTLSDLSISKDAVVKTRPEKLQSLKIKEKFITSDQPSYIQAGAPSVGASRADLSGNGSTVSHYEFIL